MTQAALQLKSIGCALQARRHCKRQTAALWALFAFVVLVGGWSSPARSQAAYGLAVDTTTDTNQGITAPDFYKLLDNALVQKGKPKFSSLIMVFGSCNSAPFSNQLPQTDVGMSGAPVASLAATDKNNPDETCSGSQKGNLFLLGTQNEWLNNDTGKYDVPVGTVFQNSNSALQKEINDSHNVTKDGEPLTPQKPTLTALPEKTQAGKNLTLAGNPAHKKYAILFYGNPPSAFDWRDYAEMYTKLIDAGYEVQGFFGTGKQEQGVPLLANNDSVLADGASKGVGTILDYAVPNSTTGERKAMQAKQASFENLQSAFRFWRAVANDSPTAEFFFFTGGHSTNAAMPRKDLLSEPKEQPANSSIKGSGSSTSSQHRKRGRKPTSDVRLSTSYAVPSRTIQPTTNFSGFHVGGSIGARGAWSNDLTNLDQVTKNIRDATPDPTSSLSNTGIYGNLFLSYGAELPQDFYVGAQAFVGYGNNSRTIAGIPGTGAIASPAVREKDSATANETWNAGLVGKFGKELHAGNTPILVNGLAGVGFQQISVYLNCTAAGACGTNGIIPSVLSASTVLTGFLGGVEVQAPAAAILPGIATNNSIISFQYLHGDYGHFNAVVGEPAQIQINLSKRVTTDTFTSGFSWPF